MRWIRSDNRLSDMAPERVASCTMSFATPSPRTADAFVRTAHADAGAVSRLREEFSGWLREVFLLDAVQFSDIVLAVNEAMSNVAEFAYRHGERERTLSVRAAREGPDGLTVTIADRGRWQERDPAAERCSSRGRGIPLMRALADRFTLDPTPEGTRVHLTFRGCATTV